MIYFYSFIVPAILCLIAQLILDNTKLTPGHVTSLFTIIGVVLSFLGIYDKLLKLSGAGLTVIIINFGALLYKGSYYGVTHYGILGIFSNMFKYAGSIITLTIICGFILAIILKPKN